MLAVTYSYCLYPLLAVLFLCLIHRWAQCILSLSSFPFSYMAYISGGTLRWRDAAARLASLATLTIFRCGRVVAVQTSGAMRRCGIALPALSPRCRLLCGVLSGRALLPHATSHAPSVDAACLAVPLHRRVQNWRFLPSLLNRLANCWAVAAGLRANALHWR